MKIPSAITAVLLAGILSGCIGEELDSAYRPNARLNLTQPGVVAKPMGEPQILRSTNVNDDVVSLIENGYVLLGQADYVGHKLSPGEVSTLARKVGAEYVTLSTAFAGSRIEYETVQTRHPISPISPAWDPDAWGSPVHHWGIHCKTGFGCQSGYEVDYNVGYEFADFSVAKVPVTVNDYDNHAMFWAPTNFRPALGVHVRDLSDNERRRYGRNTGALVWAVYRDTAAEMANIARGDIITTIDGQEVVDSGIRMGRIIRANVGKVVKVTLLRGNRTITKTVRLADRSW